MFKIIQYSNTIDFNTKLEKQIQSYYYHFSNEFAEVVRKVPVFLLSKKDFIDSHPEDIDWKNDNSYPETEVLGYYLSKGSDIFPNKPMIAINYDYLSGKYKDDLTALFLKVLIHEYAHGVYDIKQHVKFRDDMIASDAHYTKYTREYYIEEAMANAYMLHYLGDIDDFNSDFPVVEDFVQKQPLGYKEGYDIYHLDKRDVFIRVICNYLDTKIERNVKDKRIEKTESEIHKYILDRFSSLAIISLGKSKVSQDIIDASFDPVFCDNMHRSKAIGLFNSPFC